MQDHDITGLLVVLGACALTGTLLGMRAPLLSAEPGARRLGWAWPWGALVAAGTALMASESLPALRPLALVFASLFPFLMLACAFDWAGRAVPRWVLPLGIALGTARLVLLVAGDASLAQGLPLFFEPLALVAAARLVARAGREQGEKGLGVAMGLGLLALAVVETSDAVAGWRAPARDPVAWAQWLGVGLPLLVIQGIASHRRRQREMREAAARSARQEARRLEAAERLRRAQKLESLGLMAGGIAHDFNNLLTGILGNTELAMAKLPAGHEARESLESAIDAAERAAALTRQLLAFAGKGRLEARPVAIGDLVRDGGALLTTALGGRATLELDLADDLPAVEADADQLQLVLMNLVWNAAEAVAETGGHVRVRTGAVRLAGAEGEGVGGDPLVPGRYVFFEVADDGPGMDRETSHRVFDPFFTTKATGRGLGLAAALGIVRAHRGDIHLETAPGRGARFRVLLPASERSAEDRAGPEAPASMGAGCVLVVDDEPLVLDLARRGLERHGYRVITARDGAEALQRFRAQGEAIDAAVLDLAMPGMDGDRLLRELRALRADLPVLMISGYDEAAAEGRAAVRPAVGFLQKPFTAADLASRLIELLDSR